MNNHLSASEITLDDLYYDDYHSTNESIQTNTRRFDHMNGVEALEMINEIIAIHDHLTRDDRYLIEWMIREKLPSSITGYNTVRAWISDEHKDLAELLPLHLKKHLALQ
ncbi:hypothetical protein [Pseudomonas sp. CM27]|uniref:hypothetical protein n=1 Tax=Pseudomonas sp. CM27 TaxID=2738452 RepID=UPI0015575E04|nr:hypothetical protein [Pseudomonas sp. CM27]NQD72907.1 hypothetical protein [Pseudomonas sp. CM27]